MPPIYFASESYTSRSLPLSAQRCVNFFVEKQVPGAKSEMPIFGVPGMTDFAFCPQPIRALWVMKDVLYAVSGSSFYSVSAGGTIRKLSGANVIGGSLPVSVADNGYQVCIVDGTNGWIYDANADTFAVINSPDFYPCNTVTFFDDYFVFDRKGTNQFFLSELLDGTKYDGQFASAQASSAPVVGTVQNLQLLYIFCEDHTELWYDAGASDFPFQRYSGGVVNRGCIAPLSIIKQDEAIFFMGDDKIFYRLQGQYPIRVSTHAVEHAFSSYPDIASCFCFTYTLEGHKFINVVFPQSLHTWVYDISTAKWHERESWDSGDQSLGRWRANCAVTAFNQTYVGDAFDGAISLVDWNNYTERGNLIPGLIHSAPIHSDRHRVFVSKLELDVETGVGLTIGQGSDPQFMLRRSTDGGRTWSLPQLWKSLGKIGEYQKLLRWYRQGQGRQMMWELTISDPVKRVIIQAHADYDIGV